MAILDGLGNVGNTIGSTFSGAASGAVFMAKIFMYGLGFAVLAFFLYKMFFEFRVRVTLVRRIGEGALSWQSDNAKIITDKSDGTRYLTLMRTRQGRNRITTQVPPAEFKGRKGKNDHYFFILDDNYQLQSIKPLTQESFGHPFLKLFPEDKRWWARKEDKRRLDKYVKQSALEKFLPSIVVITAFVITFFIAYFGFSHIGGGMEKLASQFAQLAASCTQLG